MGYVISNECQHLVWCFQRLNNSMEEHKKSFAELENEAFRQLNEFLFLIIYPNPINLWKLIHKSTASAYIVNSLCI